MRTPLNYLQCAALQASTLRHCTSAARQRSLRQLGHEPLLLAAWVHGSLTGLRLTYSWAGTIQA